ncbi:MAG: DUF4013 domain-containing protein [Planctomycetota bacterium]|jgi:hypothetical protein
MSTHPHAAGLFVIDDPEWRRKVFRGGLLLLVPTLGWPALLGYRSALVDQLLRGEESTLPEWRGAFWRHAWEGVKGIGVIFGYLAPLYVLLAVLVLQRGYVPGSIAAWWAGFFVVFPIFSTLSFPLACVALTFATPNGLGGVECAALIGGYGLVVFLVPAGFLRVSVTRRHASAFAVWITVPFILRRARAYLSAWWHAGLMSLAGHLALPLAPWGVVWAYGSIVFLFNEVLIDAGDLTADCWLGRARKQARWANGLRVGPSTARDGAGRTVTTIALGPFSAPLPRMPRTSTRRG